MVALTWYDWFKAAHVMAAVLWVGGGALLTVYAILTQRQDDPAEMASLARKAGLIGQRFFSLLSFVVLGFGFALVENGNWGYDKFFVQFGLAAWAASTAIGIFFLGPEAGKLGKLMLERPPEDPEVQRRIRRILVAARLDVVLLLATVFVMTAKPWL